MFAKSVSYHIELPYRINCYTTEPLGGKIKTELAKTTTQQQQNKNQIKSKQQHSIHNHNIKHLKKYQQHNRGVGVGEWGRGRGEAHANTDKLEPTHIELHTHDKLLKDRQTHTYIQILLTFISFLSHHLLTYSLYHSLLLLLKIFILT